MNNEFDKKKEKSLEEEREEFLAELNYRESLLDETPQITTQNVISKSKNEFKRKIIRSIVMIILFIIFLFGVSKMFYYIANSITLEKNISIATSVVNMAVINYNRDKGFYPIDKENKVDVPLLIKTGYINFDAEENCDCYFYLSPTNKELITKNR